jgi:periplasmic copper chaperone A
MRDEMKKLIVTLTQFFSVAIGMLSLFIMSSANAGSIESTSSIEIKDAWVRAVPPVVKTTAGYMTLINHSDKDLEISSISSPQFNMVEAHNTIITNGIAQMVSADNLLVTAKSELIFKPEGLHIMLMMSKIKLIIGTPVQISFTFSDGTQIEVEARIK